MKFAHMLFAATAIAAIASAPAQAGGLFGGGSSPISGFHRGSSTSGGPSSTSSGGYSSTSTSGGHMSTSGGSTPSSSSSGGMPSSPGTSSSSGGTSVPEPSDAILLLMGAAGVVIGRKLHARAKRNADA